MGCFFVLCYLFHPPTACHAGVPYQIRDIIREEIYPLPIIPEERSDEEYPPCHAGAQ